MGTIQSRIFYLLQHYGPMSFYAIYDLFKDNKHGPNYIRKSLEKLKQEGIVEFNGFHYSIFQLRGYNQVSRGYEWIKREDHPMIAVQPVVQRQVALYCAPVPAPPVLLSPFLRHCQSDY